MAKLTSIFFGLLLIAWPLCLSASDFEDISINEVCASNSNVIPDDFNEYNDWIEVLNSGEEDLSLGGLLIRITEGSDQDIYQISDPDNELIVPAGGFFILWADNQPQQGAAHLDFKISADGATIELLTSDLQLLDIASFDFMHSDISYGRAPGTDSWFYYSDPTPNSANAATGFEGLMHPPYFLGSPVFIDQPSTVSIHHTVPQADIYYTVNGDAPTTNSTIYTNAFQVEPGDVVKAIATRPNYLNSHISSKSFIMPMDLTLDIMSISASEDDFWGDEGIYTNPYTGEEKPVTIEYYTPDGTLQLQQSAGIKIHAPDGRQQKSLRLYARAEYGNNLFEYPFFPQKNLAEHKRLVLRNAGNDGLELGKTGLRDPLIHELYLAMNPDNNPIAGFRPVHLYLNGDYWGIYNLRERQDEFYIEYNYGETEVDFIERTAQTATTWYAIAGTLDDYQLMEETAVALDLAEQGNYEIMQSWMDIDNFVDYQLIEIYINNQDWLSNNLKAWRPQDGSEKWKWILWDTDWGLGLWHPNYEHGFPDWNGLNFALSDWGGWNDEVNTELLQNLVENEDFLWLFASRGADLLNSYLRSDKIIENLNDISTLMEPDMEHQFDRWGSNMSNWQSKLDYVEDFVQDRPSHFRHHFKERFELIDTHEITLEVDPVPGGIIEVNTIEATSNPWSGIYYEALPVRLRAVAATGYQFVGWEGIDETEAEIWVDLTSDSTFTALFEYTPGQTQPLVINEINYHSGLVDPGEWVEIFNPGPDSTNLSGWQFTDGSNAFTFSDEIYLPAHSFIVLCDDTAAFNAVYTGVDFYVGEFQFNLNNNGETLRLISPFQEVMDEVSYLDTSPWPIAADGNGPTLELDAPDLDNNNGEHWFARPAPLGTPGEHNNYIGIEDNSENTLKVKGFPNPTHDRFNILINMKSASDVSIEIYDLFGRKVNTILQGQPMVAGVTPVIWDLKSADGSSCSSGMYQMVMTAGNQKQVLRMVINR